MQGILTVGFLLPTIMSIMGQPVYTTNDQIAQPSSVSVSVQADTRGLFQDLYVQNMQQSVGSSSSVQVVTSSGYSGTDGDVGERFSHAVVKTAVALADTGLQTAHEILKTVGGEILEAFKTEPQPAAYA